METTGQLKVIGATQQVSDKFKKRDFVLTIEPTSPYHQHVQMQVTQDKCSLLDSFKVGQDVKVSFNLRGRVWVDPQGEEKYFNTIDVCRIFPSDGTQQNSPANPSSNNTDDLPF